MPDASSIRMIISDLDGVWTDGRIIYSGETREIKEFNVRDGLGVKIAQRAGIPVGVITSRKSKAVERRCHELGITDLVQSARDKRQEMLSMARTRAVEAASILYIGDDLPDLPAISAAGISAAPADAAPEVLAAVTWKLTARGGQGALREAVERLLKSRGEWDRIVADFHGAKLTTPSL